VSTLTAPALSLTDIGADSQQQVYAKLADCRSSSLFAMGPSSDKKSEDAIISYKVYGKSNALSKNGRAKTINAFL